ncbi:hypothetical protein YB2330_000683 [Saitoella coloradoensis]
MTTNILIVGAGAIGAFYASRLHQPDNGVLVSVICRSNYDAVKKDGFTMETRSFGEYSFRPANVFRSPENAKSSKIQWNYIIVATKALPDHSDDSAMLQGLVTPTTSIVLIQNGVGIEEPYAKRFPQNCVISTVTVTSAAQISQGHIKQHRWTRLEVGAYLAPSSSTSTSTSSSSSSTPTFPLAHESATKKLVKILHQGGIKDAEYWDPVEMQLVRWHKLGINAAFNPSAVLCGGLGNADMLRDPELRTHIAGVMKEIIHAGTTLHGRAMPNKLATTEAILKSTERNAGAKPSMLLDWEGGKAMELEVILGNAVRMAATKGVEMPRCQSMYALLRSQSKLREEKKKSKL